MRRRPAVHTASSVRFRSRPTIVTARSVPARARPVRRTAGCRAGGLTSSHFPFGLLEGLERPGDLFRDLGPNWYASIMGIVAVAARASRSEFPDCTCSRRPCGRWPAPVEHGVTVRADWPEIVGRVDLIVRFKRPPANYHRPNGRTGGLSSGCTYGCEMTCRTVPGRSCRAEPSAMGYGPGVGRTATAPASSSRLSSAPYVAAHDH